MYLFGDANKKWCFIKLGSTQPGNKPEFSSLDVLVTGTS